MKMQEQMESMGWRGKCLIFLAYGCFVAFTLWICLDVL
jgi:hypothetical protein